MKTVLVMGRILKISDVAHSEIVKRAGSASDIGSYLTNIFERKWQSKNKYSLAEILQTEINVLANEQKKWPSPGAIREKGHDEVMRCNRI